jgi:hypothetical protein
VTRIMKIVTVVAILSSLAMPAGAQNEPLAFEVGSVKPTGTAPVGVRGGGCRGADNPNFMANGPIVVPLGRCRFIGATLKSLASSAYGPPMIGVNYIQS